MNKFNGRDLTLKEELLESLEENDFGIDPDSNLTTFEQTCLYGARWMAEKCEKTLTVKDAVEFNKQIGVVVGKPEERTLFHFIEYQKTTIRQLTKELQ